MHIVGISIDNLVVIPGVAGIRDDIASSGCECFDRMALKNPVTNIDDVDILLHEDAARERLVPQPVANAKLVWRPIGSCMAHRFRSVVMGSYTGDFT